MRDGVKQAIREAYASCGLPYGPNPMQEEMYELVLSGDCTALLKAPTGTGKMEAVVVPALAAQRRLVLIYPALSLIEDQEMRLEQLLQHVSLQPPDRPRTLVVDTGAAMYRRQWLNGKEQRRERRHLYHGDVILTTLDKFLYRFFGFGEPKKSYTYPLRLRYGKQPLFCFDEAHSYDGVAYTNFVDLVQAIGYNRDAPRDVIVMTATMPPTYERHLLPFLTPIDYLSGERAARLDRYYRETFPRPHAEKWFRYTPFPLADEQAFCHQVIALLDEYAQPGQRIIITLEKVEMAIALYNRLLTRHDDQVLLYHGRQPHPLRQRTYSELKEREAKRQGYILVTTSAIEVGCDLDAHLLITQLCNPEQLVQRAGRCNRRGTIQEARIVVLGDHIPDYLCTLSTPQDAEQYLALLGEMTQQERFVPAKLVTLPRTFSAPDYRVQTMFAMLYEYVYEAERVNRPLHERGLVITRSWEPTITLTTGWDEQWKLQNELQISMLRCIAHNDAQLDRQCELFVRYYDETNECYVFETPRRGGCAYHQDIVVRVPASYVDPVRGYEQVPRIFRSGGNRQGYRRSLYALLEKPNEPLEDQSPPRTDTKKTSRKGKVIQKSERLPSQPDKVWWWYLDQLPSLEENGQPVTSDEETNELDEQEETIHE
jgi:CRISPR-associated endonuclease/helicase Cas3